MENEQQRGLAHFLEHMAFKGSTNLPPGELIGFLQRAGLAFGPDTNAQTGFDATIYQLDLPRNDAALVERGPGHPQRDSTAACCWPATRSSPSAA